MNLYFSEEAVGRLRGRKGEVAVRRDQMTREEFVAMLCTEAGVDYSKTGIVDTACGPQPYSFKRWRGESSWDAIERLAAEVRWTVVKPDDPA